MTQLRKYLPPSTHLAVIDDATHLMWEVAGSSERLDYSKSQAYVAKLNSDKHLGFSDWRLPTVKELISIVDYSKHDPAIDTDHFPGCKSAYYWTGTAYAANPGGCAWVVSFDYGYVDDGDHDGAAFVRAVRSAAPPSQ